MGDKKVSLMAMEDVEKYIKMKNDAEKLRKEVIQLEYLRDETHKETERLKKDGLTELNQQKQQFSDEMRKAQEDLDRRAQAVNQSEMEINSRFSDLERKEERYKELNKKEEELNERSIFVQNKLVEATRLKSEADAKFQEVETDRSVRVSEQQKIEQEKKDIEAIKSSNEYTLNQIKEEQGKLISLKNEIEKASEYLTAKDAQSKEREETLKVKEQEIEQKSAKSDEREAQLNEVEKGLIIKDEKLGALAQELAIYEQNIKAKDLMKKAEEN